MSSAVIRQRPFLEALFEASKAPQRRAQLLQNSNKDQITAVSELALNTLKGNVPIDPPLMARLRRYKAPLRTVGSKHLSAKRRREHLLKQRGSGFWKCMKDVCHCALER